MNLIQYLKDWYKSHKGTGYLKQEPDDRDYRYTLSGSTDLPDVVDLRDSFLPCRNQQYTEACTGFASAALIEYLLYKERGLQSRVSPLFNWYFAKVKHGWEEENKGVWLRYILNSIYKDGFVLEKNMPFKPNYLRTPDAEDAMVASVTKMLLDKTSYQLLSTNSIKDALNKGRPVVFGIKLNKSFYGNTDGVIKNETPNKYGHGMLIVGYDDINSVYIIRNSWGTRWGDHGYCYIPYDYMESYSNDLWTIDYK